MGNQVVPYNSTAAAPAAPTKTGNTFVGWFTDAGLTNVFSFATPITADITLYAKWTVNNYTVTFNSNGGTAVTGQVIPYNSTATAPAAPTKAGSILAGWFTDAGLTSVFNFATPITADITLYAKWQLGTLDIDANGSYDALTDGLLVIRYLFGLSGAALTDNAIGSGATRADAEGIASYLSGLLPLLDVDADGQPDALTDGLLVVRYLFGLRGAPLVQAALGLDATRTAAADIQAYLQDLMP
ncbi:MAG: InlB B-repeat-containing protein [Betaproteobacteria bacterium]|nr:InlB B-repeat-containing protein [Betaproteobacteria bacterium]